MAPTLLGKVGQVIFWRPSRHDSYGIRVVASDIYVLLEKLACDLESGQYEYNEKTRMLWSKDELARPLYEPGALSRGYDELIE